MKCTELCIICTALFYLKQKRVVYLTWSQGRSPPQSLVEILAEHVVLFEVEHGLVLRLLVDHLQRAVLDEQRPAEGPVSTTLLLLSQYNTSTAQSVQHFYYPVSITLLLSSQCNTSTAQVSTTLLLPSQYNTSTAQSICTTLLLPSQYNTSTAQSVQHFYMPSQYNTSTAPVGITLLLPSQYNTSTAQSV